MIRLIVAVVLTAFALPALAWGTYAHQVVCDIAWRNLEGNAKQQVRLLLREAGQRTFATACTWPDRIRSMPRYDFAKPHHFMNVDRDAVSVSGGHDCGKEGCVMSAILAYRDILRGIPVDGYHNNQDKALMFLGHFVADIHQPLHVAYEDDRGGTRFMVSLQGKKVSLHYVWDTLVIERGMPDNWRRGGEALEKMITQKEREEWSHSDVADWATESLTMTRQIYQEIPPLRAVDREYLDYYHLYAERRLQQAGIRLAHMLNTIYN